MSTILYALGRAFRNQPTTTTNSQGKRRNRLQKAPRENEVNYCCKEILIDVAPAQACLTLFPADDDTRTGVSDREASHQAQPHHIRNLEFDKSQPPTSSKLSNDSISIYSMEELGVEMFKRTRAKTPCFWIGHLDSKPRNPEIPDLSNALARQYQAVLPPRTFTPFPELDTAERLPRTVRKVKGQQSLRDLITCQEASVHSDSETLVGTPSLGSPTSGHFSWKESQEYLRPMKEEGNDCAPGSDEGKDVGFRICLDLLTSELATGLFKKHPTEGLDRASGLQILLMIEAYESVQQHIRQEIGELHVTGAKMDQVKEVAQTLDNWLGALYTLYDRTKSTKSNGSLRSCSQSISSSPIRPSRKSSSPQSIRSDLHDFRFDFSART